MDYCEKRKISFQLKNISWSQSTTVTRLLILQGDPNRNFLFQMALQLKQIIFDPMLVKWKLVWEAVVFYTFQIKMWKMAVSIVWLHDLVDSSRLVIMRSLVRILPGAPKKCLLLEKLFTFQFFWKKIFSATKNYRLSNQFCLSQHGVKYASF